MKTCVGAFLLIISSYIVFGQNYSAPTGAGNSGTDNTAVGSAAGDNVTGSYNTFLGKEAGKTSNSSVANNNTFIGYRTGFAVTSGHSNTFLGCLAGRNNLTGIGNVFLGKEAGYNETGSNKLYIDNSAVAVPLIYGDFAGDQLGINSLPASTHTLTVGGTISATALCLGTTNAQGYRLAVAGKIVAEEIVVKLQANWPDYVFDEGYKLMPLTALHAYITKNKHLPEVPPAAEIASNGVSVGEMNVILVKKIEELTLYLIELRNKTEDQQKEIDELKRYLKK